MKSKRKQLDRELIDSVVLRDIDRVHSLLGQGASVRAKDHEHSETPLTLAVKFTHVGIVRLLLESGAEVDSRDDWGMTPLFHAPVSSEVFGVLLSAGADVHAKDNEGNTILMKRVSESASLADVEELLQLGIEPGVRNESEETALDLAESLGLVKVAERLQPLTG